MKIRKVGSNVVIASRETLLKNKRLKPFVTPEMLACAGESHKIIRVDITPKRSYPIYVLDFSDDLWKMFFWREKFFDPQKSDPVEEEPKSESLILNDLF